MATKPSTAKPTTPASTPMPAVTKTLPKAPTKPVATSAKPKAPAAPVPAKAAAPAPAAAKPAKPAKQEKAEKTEKADKPAKQRQSLVRDSFTMPKADFDLIANLKARAMGAQRAAKKSELLRAGLQALAGLDAATLVVALNKLEPLKAGRPKKGH